jgi:hypothetical protein
MENPEEKNHQKLGASERLEDEKSQRHWHEGDIRVGKVVQLLYEGHLDSIFSLKHDVGHERISKVETGQEKSNFHDSLQRLIGSFGT